MNTGVDVATFKADVGENGIFELSGLIQWLSHGKPGHLDARLAPSIVTRAEAELLGISLPRFAFRVNLTEGNGFIHVRRLQRVRDHIERFIWTRSREAERLLSLRAEKPDPTEVIQCESAIADCLLKAPTRLSRFRILASRFRADSHYSGFQGTPFLKSSMVGGGMCAQAVCFMATSLLQEHAERILPPAALTLLLAPQENQVQFSGLSTEDVERFPPLVGLSGVWQKALSLSRFQSTENFSDALRAYIRSGFPVIFPVDHTKLASSPDSVYARNGVFSGCARGEENPHMVLLVGWREDKAQFIFNDPAAFPFMVASADELGEVNAFDDNSSRFPHFLPVTPNRVKLPLHHYLSTGPEEAHRIWRAGLIQNALWLHEGALGFSATYFNKARPFERLYLSRLSQVLDLATAQEIPIFGELVRRFAGELASKLRWDESHWIWIHFTSNSIWWWDAERDPLSDEVGVDASPFFPILVVFECAEGWKSLWADHSVTPVQKATPSPSSKHHSRGTHQLRLMLSMSLPTLDDADTLRHLKKPDLIRLCCSYHDFFSESSPSIKSRAIRRNAKTWLSNLINSQGLTLGSITIYDPGIFSEDSARAHSAQAFCVYLFQLAAELNRVGHSISSVALVGASKIGGLRSISHNAKNDRTFVANCFPRARATERVVARLRSLRRAIESSGALIPLALDLEPGPFSLVPDWEGLVHLCDRLDVQESLSDWVGLNLDITHWAFLAGIGVEHVIDSPSVQNRIIHAHLSDYTHGHYCDVPIHTFGTDHVFQPWIDLLTRLNSDRREGQPPRFTGHLSLELEAFKDLAQLRRCVSNLERSLWSAAQPGKTEGFL